MTYQFEFNMFISEDFDNDSDICSRDIGGKIRNEMSFF